MPQAEGGEKPMDIPPLVPQGSQVIHAYGPGMFRIADTI